MYLVHIALHRPDGGGGLPADALASLWAAVSPGDHVEHISVHPHRAPHPVVGVYLLTDSLEAAEAGAERFCRRALTGSPDLADWQVLSVGVPLVGPF
ncbi:hypothetical protein [Kitasatospora sp. NBC_00458]|uniref:hypothetical protein n=1 Tax=Kitasatospora sp. NBC_00458 TaxID=2903568 RepID=UPI002E17EB0E